MQAINYTECYVVNRLVGLAQFCRIQPKRPYVINTCICNVVEAIEVEAKLHITVGYMTGSARTNF